jgi:glucosamine--fructose-6-phosphate aminotransferase (isomerizing)
VEKEIYDIPIQANLSFERNKGLILPEKVPYLGMGSSYFAALVLHFLGVRIYPELAGEYFSYLKSTKQFSHGVLISQSGRTSDVLACTSCFENYTAIVNDVDSPLAHYPNLKHIVPIYAGEEKFSSTKTFINTLVVLYLGHGFDVRPALDAIQNRFPEFKLAGEFIGSHIEKSIRKRKVKSITILGNGPNYGTACQAALLLSETTKFQFIGMALSQYEHGFKETAGDSVVIILNPLKSVLFERTRQFSLFLEEAGAQVFEITEPELDETLSPFTTVMPVFFLANYLAEKLKIAGPFLVGDKVTERHESTRVTADPGFHRFDIRSGS